MIGSFSYDAASVSVGDTVWVRRSRGWRAFEVTPYKVERKTPSGQVVAKHEHRSVRLNKHGDVMGDDYSRVVSEAEARKIQEQCRQDAIWSLIRTAADALVDACRAEDRASAEAAIRNASADLAKLPTHSEAEV